MNITKLFLGVCLIALAERPCFGQDLPPDTIISRLTDYCNQPRQVNGFNAMIKSGRWRVDRPLALVEVRSEYDTPGVRNAFKAFVRSFTLEDHEAECGTNFQPSFYLGRWEEPMEGYEHHDDSYDLDLILALYVGWGFTEDLYAIADSIFNLGSSAVEAEYTAFVQNEIGIEYWQYLVTNTNTVPGYDIGIEIASYYLGSLQPPDPIIAAKAVEILSAGATSTEQGKRFTTAQLIIGGYLEGRQPQLGPKIEALINDPDPDVSSIMKARIRSEQRSTGRLLEFNVGQ